MAQDALDLETVATFGELLKHLRRRARLTQQELGIAVGYSYAHVARLESGQRIPDLTAVRVRFLEALDLAREPALAQRLVELAKQAHATLGEDSSSPTTRHLPYPTNLPIPLTRFIGRKPAIAQVKRLIGAHRLVTLIGSGGVGKTRLGIEVGASFVGATGRSPLPALTDGVWLAEFAPLADPALIPKAVAAVFNLPEHPGRSHLEVLTTFLRDKHLLLVLDNCEHLVQACAELAEALLSACPHLRLLATSREALRVPGEVVWRVPSLSTPDPTHLPPSDALAEYEAVQLFLDRALAARPDFELTPDHLAVIAQICHRLDGIPLAIELAAARVHVLPAEHILAHLDDRFSLLTGGSRTALPRQQTLRATIDWSFQTLTAEERVLFRRLAVFAGGWTLPAARAVTSTADQEQRSAPTSSTLQLLLRLVDKSLVYTKAEAGGEVRYGTLETIRAYALEQLVASGEAPLMQQRHAGYFLAFAEQAEPKLHEPELLAWLNRLELEHDNMRVALSWSQSTDGDATLGLRLAGALWWFWLVRAHLTEGRVWIASALAQADGGPSLARVTALNRIGFLALWQNDKAAAHAYYEESLPLGQALGDKHSIAEVLCGQAEVAAYRGHYAQAEALFEESLALFAELGDTWHQALTLFYFSGIPRWRGDYARAEMILTQSLSLFRGLKDHWGIARTLYLLAVILTAQGEYESAEALLAECLGLAQELGDRLRMTWVYLLQGTLARVRKDYRQTEALIDKSLPLFRELGLNDGLAVTLQSQGITAHYQGDYARAETLLTESLRLERQHGDDLYIVWGLAGMGHIAMARANWERAVRLYGRVQARIDASGLLWFPDERAEYEHNVAAARTQLDPALFAAAWAEGYAMSLQQAIDYALTGEPTERAPT